MLYILLINFWEKKTFVYPIVFLYDCFELKKGVADMISLAIGFIIVMVSVMIALIYADKNKAEKEAADNRERIRKAQRELLHTIHWQQGLTLKFIKAGDRYIHTLCDGQLLYKLGITPDKIIGRDLRDFLPKECAENKLKYYIKAWDGEETNYDASLNGIDYFMTLNPIFKDGKVIEVIGSGVDITERKRAEKVLEANEKWYKTILSVMSEGVMVYGSDDRKIVLNDMVYEMFGVTKEEFKEATILKNNIPFIHEDGTPLVTENYPIYTTLTTEKTVSGKVIGVKCKDKTTWLSVNSKLLDPIKPDETPQVLFTMSDITQIKEQEMNLKESYALRRTIIDSLPIGLLVTDNDFNLVSINYTAMEIFKINEPIREVIGKNSAEFRPNVYKDMEKEERRIMEIVAGKKPVVEELETKDNRILERNYFPFVVDGELKGHLWTFEDITERKSIERSLIMAKEDAVKANLAKSEFLSKMSHELRTPLNAILGFSQILELDQTLTEQQKKFVEEILKGGRHLLDLINEILDLSRIETGRLQINAKTVDIYEVINECADMLEVAAKNKGIRIRKQLSGCANKFVHIDQVRVRQVILNLLDNAIKYNKDRGDILLTCEWDESDLLVHVLDTGIGIEKDELERIFAPFYRIGHSNEIGAGIGLSLVQQLTALMGGKAGVTSKIGVGSDFWFTIPIGQGRALEGKRSINHNVHVLTEKSNVILYIEDHCSNRELVAEILAGTETKLIFAETGSLGLQLAATEQTDLILLDMQLPDMTGFEVLERLKGDRSTAEIPVIALSANAMPDYISQALSTGFKEYLTKPIDIPLFLKTIAKYM